jgi:hypothetical protein
MSLGEELATSPFTRGLATALAVHQDLQLVHAKGIYIAQVENDPQREYVDDFFVAPQTPEFSVAALRRQARSFMPQYLDNTYRADHKNGGYYAKTSTYYPVTRTFTKKVGETSFQSTKQTLVTDENGEFNTMINELPVSGVDDIMHRVSVLLYPTIELAVSHAFGGHGLGLLQYIRDKKLKRAFSSANR